MYSYHLMVVLIGYQRNLFILGLLDDLYAIKGGRWVLAYIEVRLTTTQATNLRLNAGT